MKLSIVVPAYNEEHRIAAMLDAYTSYLARHYGREVELLVVVNGSSDGTAEMARRYCGGKTTLRVIEEPRRIGKGGALILGFREAAGELVGFVDADASTPPEEFDKLVRSLGEADGVIASRWKAGAVVEPRQPLLRRMASRSFNLMVRVMFGIPVTDTQCGAKVFRREALHAVLPSLGITRWAFDVDLLFKLRRAGFRVIEVPTLWHDRQGSSLRVGRASLEMVLAIIRLRLIYSPFSFLVSCYNATLGRWWNAQP